MMARAVNDAGELLRLYAQGERNFEGSELEGANLEGANLEGVTLIRSNLIGANLTDATLKNTRLHFARIQYGNLQRAKLDGAHFHDAHFENATFLGANLQSAVGTDATLSGAQLQGANLGSGWLDGVNFTGANLERANLCGANLGGANLGGANLTDAWLVLARLEDAILDGANLERANLERANLERANLGDAQFEGATLGGTYLVDLSMNAMCRAQVTHTSPSHVDFRAVIRSLKAPRLKEFLRKSGMPDVFVEYMFDCARSIDPGHLFSLLQSTFISYGSPDEPFARKLNDALEYRGVTTFFFKDDALVGERLDRMMRRGVNEYDRVILICSEASLRRPGVLYELDQTLAREARDGGNEYLLPVTLDSYVFDGWNSPGKEDVVRTVKDRVIADYRNHQDEVAFQAELAKLIAALKKNPPKPFAHL